MDIGGRVSSFEFRVSSWKGRYRAQEMLDVVKHPGGLCGMD